ncbi:MULTISPECIES: GNAT family N-acetyltransferase [unclassified Clostridium]|uniref:GNAT family N-acetyltransferase n=1 Tax=unclassified Clostridium TaxID=2614128 RepID=UPI001105BCFF|nr:MULTISPECIES: GNAT family N-acetyltransferase [unclassified Clostridium]
MEIIQVKENKKKYLDLLLLADEQEDMVDRYLERGDMFVLSDGSVRAECVVTNEGPGTYELKNIATAPLFQRQGYGRRLIEYLFNHYPDLQTLYVGTGDSPLSLDFYHACGFKDSHRVERFFTDNYDHPIIEAGIQLVDMVYLKRERVRD